MSIDKINKATDIVTVLRQRHANVTKNEPRITTPIDGPTIFLQAADEIERLRVERDEARREWCIQSIEAQEGNRASVRILAKKLAEDIRGWDCFKENTDA